MRDVSVNCQNCAKLNSQPNNLHPMFEISLKVKINPTEDEEKVREAILNLFPEAEIIIDKNYLNASILNMDYFIQRIGEQQIRDAARNILLKSIQNEGLKIYLSKQAAFVKIINFTDGKSILGDIEIDIKTDEPDKIIQIITEVI